MTAYWIVNKEVKADDPVIGHAAELLRQGRLVAFPTETVYGLGADASNAAAVALIYKAKGRPADNPLIVHIADWPQLDSIAQPLNDVERRLAEQFWPGPLTLVLRSRPGTVPDIVTAGLSTVAVRMPAHPVALALIRAANCPVAAPSANRSGKPSPTEASHVKDDLHGRIAAIVDGGSTGYGLESTVVQCSNQAIHLLRPGGITAAMLERASGLPVIAVSDREKVAETPQAPGMKYAHYAPQGKLLLVQGDHVPDVLLHMQRLVDEAKQRGETTGILTYEEFAGQLRSDWTVACGSWHDLSLTGRKLYGALRSFDSQCVSFIVAQACPQTDIGQAIMNRLIKAADHHVISLGGLA